MKRRKDNEKYTLPIYVSLQIRLLESSVDATDRGPWTRESPIKYVSITIISGLENNRTDLQCRVRIVCFHVTLKIGSPAENLSTYFTFPILYYINKQQMQVTRMLERTATESLSAEPTLFLVRLAVARETLDSERRSAGITTIKTEEVLKIDTEEVDSAGMGCKMRSKIAVKCFNLYILKKKDGLVSLAFLELLEKVVLPLT